MLDRIWKLIKRNRGKLVAMSVLAGGTYVAVNYVRDKFKEYQELEAVALCDTARKYHHFDSVQRSCNITVLSLLPNVERVLQKCFSVEDLLQELEQGSGDKIAKWQQLKIISIARAMSTMYVCCVLVTLLRVQFNIIAGYIYPDSVTFNVTDTEEVLTETSMPLIQKRYLELIHYFIYDGIPQLCVHIQKAVTSVMGDVSLKERFSRSRLKDELDKVRCLVETRRSRGQAATASLTPFMMPPSGTTQHALASVDDQLYEKLMAATKDTINSEYFHDVLQQELNKGHTQLMAFVGETYSSVENTASVEIDAGSTGVPSVEIALAKLVPVMCGLYSRMCRSEHNSFMPQLMVMPTLQDFASRVYEAACYRDSKVK